MSSLPDNLKLYFIGGSGRSGTTVLREVISTHSTVAGMYEFRITIDPDGLVDFFSSLKSNWSPYLFDIKIKRLENLLRSSSHSSFPEKAHRYFLKKTGLGKLPWKLERKNSGVYISDFCPNYDKLVSDLINDLKEFTYSGFSMGNSFGTQKINIASYPNLEEWEVLFGDFYRAMASSVAQKQNKSAFIDDNTWNILHFDTLLSWLPEAKMVHIYRHPLDVIASYTKQAWAPKDPVQAAKFYTSIMKRWFMVRENLQKESYHEVALESLSSDPEGVLSDITDFYGLNWEEQLLNTDLSKSNSGRWKSDLPEQQLPQIIEIVQPVLDEYGYSIDD